MPRKLLNEVDGFIVDEFQGTFTGAFDVRGADAKYLAYDDEVLIVVRARVKPPRLKEMRNGDIVRVNVLHVKEGAVVRSDELKTHLCDTLGMAEVPPQLTLDGIVESTEDVLPLTEVPELETPAEFDVFVPEGTGPAVADDGFVPMDVQSTPKSSLKVQKFRSDPLDADLAEFMS